MRNPLRNALLALLMSSGGLAMADTATITTLETESARVDGYAVGHGSTVENRISNTFTDFAGSPENASALTSGLRQGTPIDLTSLNPDGTTTITRFSPATGPMGYGNVRISMALAQQQLARLGITNPTPEQLTAALNGGTVTYVAPNGVLTTTDMQGVLERRAAGQGWGEIAQSNGTKLGPVISGLKSTRSASPPAVTHPVHGGTPTAVTTAAGTTKATGSGVTRTSHGNSSAGGGHAYGQGIVTAYGTGASGVVTTDPGKGSAHGATAKVTPVSTSAGGASAASGISTAHGQGNAYGQSKARGKN